jgi:glycosyl transferase family 25
MNLLPRPYSANLRRAGLHDHTHAYALSRSAARKLLDFQSPVRLNVDTGIGRLVLRGELEAYVSEPKLFRQRGGTSYILRIRIKSGERGRARPLPAHGAFQ